MNVFTSKLLNNDGRGGYSGEVGRGEEGVLAAAGKAEARLKDDGGMDACESANTRINDNKQRATTTTTGITAITTTTNKATTSGGKDNSNYK